MNRLLPLMIMLLALAGCHQHERTVEQETSPQGTVYERLYMPDSDEVAVQIAWPDDWIWRQGSNPGTSAIGTRLMLAGGAGDYPPGKSGERLDEMEVQANLYPTFDHVIGTLVAPREHLDEAIEIANAHLRAPHFNTRWFNRIRDRFARDNRESLSQPDKLVSDTALWAVLGDSPLTRELTLDSPGVIEGVKRSEVIDWYHAVFYRNTPLIVIAGDLDSAEAGKAIDTLLRGLPSGHIKLPAPQKADFHPRRILLHRPTASTSTLLIFAPLTQETTLQQQLEDILLANALGGGTSSVLFDTVRMTLRATYQVGAAVDSFTRSHLVITMRGDVDTDSLDKVVDAIEKTYTRFRQDGPSRPLEAARAPISSALASHRSDAAVKSNAALQGLLIGEAPEDAFRIEESLDAITEKNLAARLSEGFPTAQAFTIIAVSPDADALPGACVIESPREAADCP